MRNKLPAIIAFCVLFLLTIGWVVYYLKQPLKIPQSERNISSIKQGQQRSVALNQQSWVEDVSNQKKETYIYPTNEMILKYNFDKGVEPLRIFIEDLSEYRFYCINQILLQNKIEFAYYKTNKTIQLVIFLNDQKMQHKILEDFDYYKIQYSLYSSK